MRLTSIFSSGVIPTMDVWAGALAAVIYGVGTLSHPAYEPVNSYLVGKPMPFMTPLGARSIVVIVLTALYTVRVASVHYLPRGAKKRLSAPAQKLGATQSQKLGTNPLQKPAPTPSQNRPIKALPKEKKGQ